jgi:hypothetical protein
MLVVYNNMNLSCHLLKHLNINSNWRGLTSVMSSDEKLCIGERGRRVNSKVKTDKQGKSDDIIETKLEFTS